MGIEIVFVLIYPVAVICMVVASAIWFAAVSAKRPSVTGYVVGYVPLIVGIGVSVTALMFLAYIEGTADIKWSIEHGYYTKAQGALYLSRRIVEEAIIHLMLVLPTICFVVIPLTVGLIRARRLTLITIGVSAAIGWITLSLVGWLWNLDICGSPYALSVLKVTAFDLLIYGLPVPLAALCLYRPKLMPILHGSHRN